MITFLVLFYLIFDVWLITFNINFSPSVKSQNFIIIIIIYKLLLND